MQNIWYFSNDFEKILIDYKNNKKYINVDKSKYVNETNEKNIDYTITDIKNIFTKNKDKLKDLAWIIVGYH